VNLSNHSMFFNYTQINWRREVVYTGWT